MGLFGKLERPAPPTATDFVESDGNPPGIDVEKATTGIQEDANVPVHQHHVHPDAERAVVCKMDWRIPPLLGFLCMREKHKGRYLKLTLFNADLLSFLDRSNIG